MNFLKSLFGGGGSTQSTSSADGDGLYFYVRPKGCDEVVRIRVNRMNDLSESEGGGTYFVRKGVMGSKCFQRAELEIQFDGNRRPVEQHVTGGDLVDEAAWQAWQATNTV